jgi:hypothetical protein
MSPLVFLTALAAGLLPSALIALFSRERIRGFDGRLRPAPTDIERLLAGFGARFYRKPDPSLARRLEWAQIPIANTPPAWRSLLILAPLTVGISTFSVMGVAGGNTFGGAVLAVVAAFVVRLYVSSRLDNYIAARTAAINDDVPAFMSSFARILAVRRDFVPSLETIAESAERERIARGAGGALRRKAIRPSDFNPYASELYTGLIRLMARKNEGLIRADATMERPDPLLDWAIWCDNSEITELASAIRSARLANRQLRAEEIDTLEDNFRAAREQRVEREAADAASRTTSILVVFNLPLLLAAMLVPVIVGAVAAIGG